MDVPNTVEESCSRAVLGASGGLKKKDSCSVDSEPREMGELGVSDTVEE